MDVANPTLQQLDDFFTNFDGAVVAEELFFLFKCLFRRHILKAVRIEHPKYFFISIRNLVTIHSTPNFVFIDLLELAIGEIIMLTIKHEALFGVNCFTVVRDEVLYRG